MTDETTTTTTTLDFQTPITIHLGSQETTVERLELDPLTAEHLWKIPADDLAARDTLRLGLLMGGYSGKKADLIAQELVAQDLKVLTGHVNGAMSEFRDAADGVVASKLDVSQAAEITLRDPVRKGSETLAKLTLQPLRGKHVWEIPASGICFGHIFGVGMAQAGEVRTVIARLSAWDAGQLVGVVSGFLTDFQTTGD